VVGPSITSASTSGVIRRTTSLRLLSKKSCGRWAYEDEGGVRGLVFAAMSSLSGVRWSMLAVGRWLKAVKKERDRLMDLPAI